jgi:hypothetical protein
MSIDSNSKARRAAWAGAALLGAGLLSALASRSRAHEATPAESPAPLAASVTLADTAPGALRVTDVAIDAGGGASASGAKDAIALGWGAGALEVGRSRPEEGNPEAPMSLAIDPKGDVVVLDQVNGRLLRVGKDGAPLGAVSLSLQAPEDVAMGKDGSMAVLDRLVDKQIAIVGSNGKVLGNLPLEGNGVSDTGDVTGVFVDGKDVYVERESGTLVRVGDTSGVADAMRPELPGRPSRDGRLLISAGFSDAQAGRLIVSAIDRQTMDHLYTRELRMGMPLLSIPLVDSDAAGIVYIATVAELPSSSGDDPTPVAFLTCLSSADGQPIRTVQLPVNTDPDETFREMTVADEGGVLFAHRTDSGMTIGRYDCR